MRAIWVPLLVFVSIATMTGANFAALTQTNTKRLLAYSSIAHVGYMLLGLIAGTADRAQRVDGIKGILIYLLVYTFMNLGAFAVITSLRHRNVIGDELDDLERPLFARPGRSGADAGVHAVAGGDSSAGGILGQIFHLSQPDRNQALRAGSAGRALFRIRALLLPEDRERDVHAAAGKGRRDACPISFAHARGAGCDGDGYTFILASCRTGSSRW